MNLESDHSWYQRARVRHASPPSIVAADATSAAPLPFAPELLPYLRHPHVQRLGPIAAIELLERARTRYLHGTSMLEVRLVNDVAADLAHGRTFDIAPADRVTALELYCDEGFHALVASDLLARRGVDEADEPPPAFFATLDTLAREEDARIVRFLFAVVTETSISQSLASLARSPVIDPALRAFVDDHARDEARHATFFARLFTTYWAQLTDLERARQGALLPRLTQAFVGPSFDAIASDLRFVGLDDPERAEVIEDSRDALATLGHRAARPALACFRRAGVPIERLFGEEV